MTNNKNTAKIFLLISFVLLLFLSFFIYKNIKNVQTNDPTLIIQTTEKEETQDSPVIRAKTGGIKEASGIIIEGKEFNTYRNEEFGFEFNYRKSWEPEEATFWSPNSVLNVVIHPIDDWSKRYPILVNVVTPRFADTTFSRLEKVTTDVEVGGMAGIVHRYEKDNINRASYVFPLGENKVILGSEFDESEEVFTEFIESFKFLE